MKKGATTSEFYTMVVTVIGSLTAVKWSDVPVEYVAQIAPWMFGVAALYMGGRVIEKVVDKIWGSKGGKVIRIEDNPFPGEGGGS